MDRFAEGSIRHGLYRGRIATTTVLCVLLTAIGVQGQADFVEQQIALLKSPDAAIRQNAAGALGMFKDKRGVEPLIGALQDPNAQVRNVAATSLGMIKDPRAVEPLIPLLKEKDFEAQAAVGMALGELRDPRAIDPLIAAMTDKSLGDGRFEIMALEQIGPAATERLIALLKNGDANGRRNAAYALEGIGGKRAVDPLIAALKDPDTEVREAVPVPLAMTGLIDHPPAKPEPTSEKDRCAQITAWRARQTEDPRVTDALLAVAKDPDPGVRETVAIALQIAKDPRAIDSLLADLKDPADGVRSMAARSLGDFDDPRIIDPLLDALSDSYQGTRTYASESIGARQKTMGDAPFVPALRSDNPTKRMAAAGILAARGNSQAIDVLIGGLKDPEPKVRILAVDSLKGVKDGRVLDALLAAMHDPDVSVRTRVIVAIGETGDPRAAAPLVAGLESASNGEKGMYLGALSNMGDQGVDALLAFLKNGNFDRRGGVIFALGATKSSRAMPALIELLKDPYDGMLHSDAAGALSEIGDPGAIGPIIDLLKGPSFDGSREMIPSVLVKFGAAVVEPLIALLHDENNHARLLAAQALGQVKDPRAEKALLDALHEGNEPAIAGASLFFVFRGELDSEDALVEALDQYGDELMANLFLNCGNPKLEAAARVWGHKRGWEMQQQVYGLKWGHQPTTPGPCEVDLDG